MNIHIAKDTRVNFTNALFSWFTCLHIFLVILKVTLFISFIHKIIQPTEEKILPITRILKVVLLYYQLIAFQYLCARRLSRRNTSLINNTMHFFIILHLRLKGITDRERTPP